MLVAYVLLAAGFYFLADSVLFAPQYPSYRDTSDIIKLETKSGKKISAIYFPNPHAKYTILFSHGNAEDIGLMKPFLQLYQQQGFSILAYDYQGYGTSEGRPSEENTYQDIQAAYDFLTKDQGIPAENIILHGRSLGSGPSVYLAKSAPIKALILESSFVSAFRVETKIPLFPFDKYPNINIISDLTIPLLVIHGTKDRIIAPWHGKKLFAASPGFKQSYWVNGADHNNLYQIAHEQYWMTIKNFIQQLENQKDNNHE